MAVEYFGLRAMSVHFVSSLHTTRMLEGKERSKSKKSNVRYGAVRDDLLEKVRHEEVILILVRQNDAFEVCTRDFPVPSAAQELGTHVERIDYNDVWGLVSNDPHLHTERE